MDVSRRKLLSLIPASLILVSNISFEQNKRVKLEILYRAQSAEDLQKYLNLINASNLINIKNTLIKKKDTSSILSECGTKLFSTHFFDSLDDLVYFKKMTTQPGVVGKKERLQLGISRTIKVTYV